MSEEERRPSEKEGNMHYEVLHFNHLRSCPSKWFPMPTDNGLAVCATVVRLPTTYNLLTTKHFEKHLTIRKCLLKGKVRPGKVPETRRESVCGHGCRKGVFSPGGPNPRIHTRRLRGQTTPVGTTKLALSSGLRLLLRANTHTPPARSTPANGHHVSGNCP